MKKLSVFLFFFFGLMAVCREACAQPNIFQNEYHSQLGMPYDIPSHIVTNDGGMLFMNILADNASMEYITLIKLDEYGAIQWKTSFGPRLHMYVRNVVQSPDGSYFFAVGDQYATGYDIVKLDVFGNLLFKKRIDLPPTCYGYSRVASLACNDGGYYIANTIGDTITLQLQWNLLKLDSAGNVTWSHSYNTAGATGNFFDMDTCSTGDVVMLGEYYDMQSGYMKCSVTKVAPNGNYVWTKYYVDPTAYSAHAADIDCYGDKIAITLTPFNGWTFGHPNVMLLDENGNVTWFHQYRLLPGYLIPHALSFTSSHNIVVLGSLNLLGAVVLIIDTNGQVLQSRLKLDWMLLSMGEIHPWEYSFGGFHHYGFGKKNSILTTDVAGSDCAPDSLVTINMYPIAVNVYMGGQHFTQSLNQFSYPSAFPSINDTITLVPQCAVTGIDEPGTPVHFEFAPNPVQTVLTVTASETIDKVAVIDINGKTVMEQECNASRVNLNVEALSPGLYLLRVQTGDTTATHKIIVE